LNQARTCGDEEEKKDEDGSGSHAVRQRHPLDPKLKHARSLALSFATAILSTQLLTDSGWWTQEPRDGIEARFI